MATGRSSPSTTSCDYPSSTAHDQPSSPSDVELVSLVPTAYYLDPEQPWQSGAIALGDTERSTAYHTDVTPTSLHGNASSNRTRRPAVQSDKPSVVKRLLLDSWISEAVAMSFSIVCLAAIMFVVRAYDGERIPQLASGLTLNAIISILSTASRASLVFVVSTTIGQLKWCWLKRSRRQTRDIQAMDDASRGPLGAFGILAFWTGGSLAALGSIVTLLMIVFSPFLQQVVEYPSRNATQPGGTALAPQNLAYTHHIEQNTNIMSPWTVDVELINVLATGVWLVPKPFDKEPACSTGHCSWPKFQSVGWCSKCENRTSSATLTNCKVDVIAQSKKNLSEYCLLDLGNGANFSLLRDLEVKEGRIEGNFTSELIWPLSYGNSGASLTNIKALEAPGLSSEPTKILGVLNPLIVMGQATVKLKRAAADFDLLRVTEASQCVLNPCEKSFTLNTTNGTTIWNVESNNYGTLLARNVSFKNSFLDRNTVLCWQAEDGDVELGDGDERSYVVDWSKRAFCPLEDYAFSIQKSLQGQYDQNFTVITESPQIDAFGAVETSDFSEIGRLYNTVGPESTRNLSQRVESIATALTNYGMQTTNDTVQGEAIAEEFYVRARWQWIILPALLELATFALLILTIIQSRREDVPLWKSSVLALIYHGVDELHGHALATERLSGMAVTAKTVDVQLVRSGDGLHSLSKRSGYREVAQDE